MLKPMIHKQQLNDLGGNVCADVGVMDSPVAQPAVEVGLGAIVVLDHIHSVTCLEDNQKTNHGANDHIIRR